MATTVTDDYVNLFVNSAYSVAEPLSMLAMMFLLMGRILPIIGQSPFFGAKVMPHPVKVVFGISLFAIFLPQLIFLTTTHLDFNMTLVFYMIKEILVGTIIGYMISIPFIIIQNAGIMIDHQRGGASLMVNDPTIQNQSSPLGTLFNLVVIYLFFLIDGPFMIIDVISQSYDALPPDKFLNESFFKLDSDFVVEITKLMGKVMIVSTQLAAPALIIILMTDFFLGIANRLAPQVQITFLGMPLKSLLGLAIIFFGWQQLTQQFVTESYSYINYLYLLVDKLKPS